MFLPVTKIEIHEADGHEVLAASGVRPDGQKVQLFTKNMGGESTSAWHQFFGGFTAT